MLTFKIINTEYRSTI